MSISLTNLFASMAPASELANEGFKWQQRFKVFLERAQPSCKCMIVHEEGSCGKTWFASYMRGHGAVVCSDHSGDANGRRPYDGQKVCIFDYEDEHSIDWATIDDMLHGVSEIGNVHYGTRSSHVVILLRRLPDTFGIARDRLHVIDGLSDDKTIEELFPNEVWNHNLRDPFAVRPHLRDSSPPCTRKRRRL